MSRKIKLGVILCFLGGFISQASTFYVAVNSLNPTPPYASWGTAATNIQDAVNLSTNGDLILVNDGVYASGATVIAGITTNRVSVTNAITLQSVNGPGATTIQGYIDPDTSFNTNCVRGVYLAGGAVLSGFTVLGGETRSDGDPNQDQAGGGVWCATTNELVTNCIVSGNSAANTGGGVYQGTILNCLVTNNTAGYGGGVSGSIVTNSTFAGNQASDGGGAAQSTLYHCLFTDNSTGDAGGGVDTSLADHCVFTANFTSGVGAAGYASTINNSIITNNISADAGGGTGFCGVNNSALFGNTANWGGAAAGGTLNNCTMVGNTASGYGGGGADCTMNNCIVYYNTSPDGANYKFDGEIFGALYVSDTTPMPNDGSSSNNITAEPRLADFAHISAGSPCIGAGSTNFSSGLDIDDQPWLNPPSIGCDEFYGGAISGSLTVNASADYTNVAAGFVVTLSGSVIGHARYNVWDFGDGTTLTNQFFTAQHSWSAAGDYTVTLTAFNDDHPGGVTATIDMHVLLNPVYYVSLASVNPVSPYASLSNAATNIQDAVDVAAAGGLVLVDSGTYNIGGRVATGISTNRVVVIRPMIVQSLNGPAVTTIQGFNDPVTPLNTNSVRCVYLHDGATLSGFTLSGGATRSDGDGIQDQSGGGILCATTTTTVTNCVITGSSANSLGGGVYSGTLWQCRFTGNSCAWNPSAGGGAASGSVLNQCVITGNSAASYGGAVDNCTLNGCVLSGNSGPYAGAANNSVLAGCLVSNNYALFIAGGCNGCTCTNCLIIGNVSSQGGGAYGGELDNCRIIGNAVTNNFTGFDGITALGGGAMYCALNNCSITGNTSESGGGGVAYSYLSNCTITENTATNSGGGAAACTLNNCIVYYNVSPDAANYSGGSLYNCCTTPMPGSGTNNITSEPLLADAAHLSAGSPCIGAGSTNYATGVDIDGEPWLNPPSIGCDEFYAGAVTGALNVAVQANYTNVAAGYTVNFLAAITGHAGYNIWNFGDGTFVTNRLSYSHAWSSAGNYPVTLTVYNNDNSGGVSATVTIFVLVQPVHYVNAAGNNPVAPYLTWDTAATNIQDAVDAAFVNGTVLVTNGVYKYGGHGAHSPLMSRVSVTRPMTVLSVNGPAATIIQGNPQMGDTAVRCAYLENGAALAGFSLLHGATRTSGDMTLDQSGGGIWCQNTSLLVSNCWLTGNAAVNGGGAFQGTLNNCYLYANSAANYGGGADASILSNCALSGNTALFFAGGVENSTLYNCTLTANSATDYGGGADASILDNCIVFNNAAPSGPNYNNCNLNFSCTTPLPSDGSSSNNITADPLLSDNAHLKAGSPCIGAGSTNYSTGVDIDAQPWANPPSIGADEFFAGANGYLDAMISASYNSVATGFTVNFTGLIHGHARALSWNFGDGTIVSNQLTVAHAWASAGNYPVVLTTFNDDNSGGISVTDTVSVLDHPMYFVSLTSTNPVAPYASWATAATDIQSAVDAAVPGGVIWVTNGVYQTGGRTDGRTGNCTNRVVVNLPVMIHSVNGPLMTVIQGNPSVDPTAVRCIYLTNNAALIGFTLTQGAARNDGDGTKDQPGAGAWCESTNVLIANCHLISNYAFSGGGGAFRGTLNDCVISNNSGAVLTYYGSGGGASSAVLNSCLIVNNGAGWSGGGADTCTLNNCTIAGNTVAFFGNGVNNCTLNNCITIHNGGEDNYSSSILSYCCTPSDPGGIGNTTNDPAFINWTNSDFHLQSNSPCINAGNNAFVTVTNDLDGGPRIIGGIVDLGAYESSSSGPAIPIAWLQQYGLPTDGSADYVDTDHTGMNNWQKWVAGLNPLDTNSIFALLKPSATNLVNGRVISWLSVSNRTYYLQRSSDLTQPFTTIQSSIAGQAGTTSCTDATATNSVPYFYRVGVQ